jgi:hypothetical protein
MEPVGPEAEPQHGGARVVITVRQAPHRVFGQAVGEVAERIRGPVRSKAEHRAGQSRLAR